MKKENRTISTFRRLLLAALCCVLSAAVAAQTEKGTQAPSRIYYLPLNVEKTAKPDNDKKSDKNQTNRKTEKAGKTKAAPAPAKNRTINVPLDAAAVVKMAQQDSSAVKKKRRTAPKAAPDSSAMKSDITAPAPAKKRTINVPLDAAAVVKMAQQDSSAVKKKRRAAPKAAPDTALVKPDSVQPAAKRHFMPTRRRIDREMEKNKFVYKGETMMGLTISYGTLNTDNADMFPIFEEIKVGGSIVTLNPYIGYFYRDNNCFGVRFGYSHVDGTLDSFGVNLGEENDIELDIPWIDLSSRRFSASAFHRTYVGLDEKCRFGAFGELELSYTNGDNMFAYKSGDRLKHTRSKSQSVRVLFSPGVAVYALPNVSASVSFGLGGFKYTFTQQYDENGEKTGKRHYSNLNFRLNLLDIRIGLTFHLWNAKKSAKRAFVKQ